jgi:dTDP-glucose pyrophosphorylase
MIDHLTVKADASLRDGMQVIGVGGAEIALVVDSTGRLVGTLTDGDARRAILSGVSLLAPVSSVMNHEFTAIGPESGRAEALDLMRAFGFQQIPIVDGDGRLLGLHLLREMIGAVCRPNWAVVMAGGRGQRLHPITDDVPKPMVKVAGRPILERIILHLVGFGIRRVFVSVHYKAEVVEGHFGDGSRLGCEIDYLREEKPLGTAGALSLLSESPTEPLIVVNGDLLTQFDVGRMLAHHSEGGHVATVGIREYSHTVPFGVIESDGPRAVGLTEKPTLVCDVNAGIYVLDPRLPQRVPAGSEFSMPGLLEDCLARGEAVGVFRIDDDWLDVGRREDLLRARGQEEWV